MDKDIIEHRDFANDIRRREIERIGNLGAILRADLPTEMSSGMIGIDYKRDYLLREWYMNKDGDLSHFHALCDREIGVLEREIREEHERAEREQKRRDVAKAQSDSYDAWANSR